MPQQQVMTGAGMPNGLLGGGNSMQSAVNMGMMPASTQPNGMMAAGMPMQVGLAHTLAGPCHSKHCTLTHRICDAYMYTNTCSTSICHAAICYARLLYIIGSCSGYWHTKLLTYLLSSIFHTNIWCVSLITTCNLTHLFHMDVPLIATCVH